MSNCNGNNHGGPSFPLWKVMLVGLLVLGAMWLWGLLVFGEGGGTP